MDRIFLNELVKLHHLFLLLLLLLLNYTYPNCDILAEVKTMIKLTSFSA